MDLAYIFPMQLCLPRPRKPLRNRKPETKPRRQRFVHKYIAVDKLERTVGIEYTFIVGGFAEDEKPDYDCMAVGLVPVFKARVNALKGKRLLKDIGRVHTDPQCIEVSSGILKTRKQVRAVSEALHGVARSLNMVGRTANHGGGGAHIHIGMDSYTPAGEPLKKARNYRGDIRHNPILKALMLDYANRPYVAWAFSNPGDQHNTRTVGPVVARNVRETPPCVSREYLQEQVNEAVESFRYNRRDCQYWVKQYKESYSEANYPNMTREQRRERVLSDLKRYELKSYKRAKQNLIKARAALAAYVEPEAPPTMVGPDKAWEAMRGVIGDKTYGIQPRSNTVEFRMFQAPNHPQEHELQLNFALAYVEWAEGQAKVGKFANVNVMDATEQAAAWPLDKAQAAFLKTVRMLGLPTRPYKRYLANMARRYELTAKGKSHLN